MPHPLTNIPHNQELGGSSLAQGGGPISIPSANPRIVTIIRWIARIWSILLFVLALLIIVAPDPNVVKPVPLTDWIELGFYGVAILGLLIAWRWEGLGGAIAIAGVVGNNVAFGIIRGYWFPGLAIPAFLFVVPGTLFLACWALSRGKREVTGPTNTGVAAE